MARNELVYRGPLIVNGAEPVAGGELWSVDSTVVAFVPGPGGAPTPALVIRSAVLSLSEDLRLVVAGVDDLDVEVGAEAAGPRQALGAWTGRKVVEPGGAVVAESANVEWSTQGVSVVPPRPAARIEYPGCRTSIVGGRAFVDHWTGDPALRLEVLSTAKPCGCSGGRA